jgi:RIO kinase 1
VEAVVDDDELQLPFNSDLANSDLANSDLANSDLANSDLANSDLADADSADSDWANNFQARARPPVLAWDDDDVDPEASTYLAAQHGPEPPPGWVIVEDRARQYERGLLKTGKEAEVFLVERCLDDRTNLLAAKRYKSFEDRMFRDDSRYRQSRRAGESRIDRAMARGTRAGMAFRAQQWVETEFDILGRLWAMGASVPYPVQLLGREIMLEYIGDEQGAAPRLVQFRGALPELADLYDQLLTNLALIAEAGMVHGDLSAYNLLVWEGRLVMIDFPQAVDALLNPDGMSLLERDVLNTCGWFSKKGLPTDPSAVLADLIARLF